MANSRIDASGINDEYPVAGVDNDSQGFRDNFNLIKTGFESAKLDIQDLLSTAVLKSELLSANQIVDNDFNGNEIYNVVLRQVGSAVSEVSPTTPNLDIASANYFKIQTITSNIALAFNNTQIGALTSAIEVILELQTNTSGHTVTLPTATYTNMENVPTANGPSALELYAPGTYMYKLTTTNAGTSWFVEQLRQPSNVTEHSNAEVINLNTSTSFFTPTIAWTATLLAGLHEGQTKSLVNTGTANVTIAVTNAAWGSSIELPPNGGVMLVYVNSKWVCVGNNNSILS